MSDLVVANYGRRLLVEDSSGARHLCIPKGRKLGAVCGDRVVREPAATGNIDIITAVQPRDNALTRPDQRGRTEVLAANITVVAAVMAPSPPADPFIIDRYLAAAETMRAHAVVVINKIDLLGADDMQAFAAWEQEFAGAGYPVVRTSAIAGESLDLLAGHFAGQTAILVGQSGVGKSSLLNRLVPDYDAATATISASTGEGRHTTTASILHRLPGGGALIDSPGVRDFAPADVALRDVSTGFAEFRRHDEQCRFADCMHMREPGCAVKAAVDSGEVAPRRYESYRRLVRLMERLAPSY